MISCENWYELDLPFWWKVPCLVCCSCWNEGELRKFWQRFRCWIKNMATTGNFHQSWSFHICCIPGITINLLVAVKSWYLLVCKKTLSTSDTAFWQLFCFFQTVFASAYDREDSIFSCLLFLSLLQKRWHRRYPLSKKLLVRMVSKLDDTMKEQKSSLHTSDRKVDILLI